MKLKLIAKDIDKLVQECKVFLTVLELTDEEKEKLNQTHDSLQIRAFNSIINECKEEINSSNLEKMTGILRLLYNIESQPFNHTTMSTELYKFVTNQLNPIHINTSENDLKNMQKIVTNIKHIQESLLIETRRLSKKSKKFYIFNKSTRNKLYGYYRVLTNLEKQINYQMEYNSKNLTKHIIDDFYNTYIFLSYYMHITFENNQHILAIEIANAIDRYIDIINLVFNGRHLKTQDMLYYYLIHELNELKDSIYEYVDDQSV